MATPHIAGAMALLWSAHPELQNEINPSRAVLNNTAVHIASTECGDAGPPNNVYGWGRVDIFAAVTGTTPTPTPTSTPCGRPAWVQRAPMPFKAGPFATSDGTVVYAGGGLGDGFAVRNDLLRYDPVADSWTSLAPSPDYYFASPGVYFNGKIYSTGGFDAAFQSTNTTRIYDISTNTWTTGEPMPAALGGAPAAVWNGIIYVAGGARDIVAGEVVNTLYAYNIAANSWTTLAPMPQALFVQGFGAIGGRLYVAAGSDGHTQLNSLYIYNIASNTWTTGANVPVAAEAPGSAVLQNKLYVFGGVSPLITTQIYNPGSNTWSFGPNMNVYRWRFFGTAIGNQSIVAFGGQNAAGDALDATEQLTTSPCGPRPHPTPRR